jgi:hypothetical protein
VENTYLLICIQADSPGALEKWRRAFGDHYVRTEHLTPRLCAVTIRPGGALELST